MLNMLFQGFILCFKAEGLSSVGLLDLVDDTDGLSQYFSKSGHIKIRNICEKHIQGVRGDGHGKGCWETRIRGFSLRIHGIVPIIFTAVIGKTLSEHNRLVLEDWMWEKRMMLLIAVVHSFLCLRGFVQ